MIAVWIVAFAVIVPFSPSLADVTNEDQTSFLPSSDESSRAQALAEKHFPTASGATARFVLKREDGQAFSAADRSQIREFAGGLEAAGIAAVNSVETGPEQLAENERAQLVQVAFQGDAADDPVKDAVKELRDEAAGLLAGSGLQAGLTGDAASAVDTEESFGSAETITFAATFVLILLLVGGIFRSPIAAFLPIATIGLVFLLATSLVALLSDTFGFEVDSSLTSLLIVVLFGIGTDYILFLLFRYRERLRAGDESRAAVAFSVRRVGQAVASSALVVIIAFLALLLARLGFFRTMAPGLIISVAVTLLASLTLIPAAIALVGPRVFWPSKRWQTAPTGTAFKKLGQLIARRPGRMALASGGAMLALAAGAVFYTANYDTSSSLPSDTESSQANEDIKRRLRRRGRQPHRRLRLRLHASPAERAGCARRRAPRRRGRRLGRRAGPLRGRQRCSHRRQPDRERHLERGARCRRGAAPRRRPRLHGRRRGQSGRRQLGLRRHPLRARARHGRRLPDRRAADRARARSAAA